METRPELFRNRTRIRIGEADLTALRASLRLLPEKIRNKVAKKGMKSVLIEGKRMAKALALPQDQATKRAVSIRTKIYRRRFVWGAVGVRVGGPYTEGRRFGEAFPGWRSHFWDGGFRVWQKGVKANGRRKRVGAFRQTNANPKPFTKFNRGWRKGKSRRHLSQQIIGRRLYLTQSAHHMSSIAVPRIREAVAEALKEASRGSAT